MRTLILSCSATKRGDAGLLPALARYDGPAYRTLRANLAEAGELRVLILSAEFGLIDAELPIGDYDRRMTATRGAELVDQVRDKLRALEAAGELAGDVLVYGGALYRETIEFAGRLAELSAVRMQYTRGGIGEQLGQLKAFLLERPSNDDERRAELDDAERRNPAAAQVMRETGMGELQALRHLRDRRELQRLADRRMIAGRRL